MKDKGESMNAIDKLSGRIDRLESRNIDSILFLIEQTKAIKARLDHIEEQLKQPKPRKSNVVYMGKPIDDMTRDELIDSLEATCTYISSFNCILKDTI